MYPHTPLPPHLHPTPPSTPFFLLSHTFSQKAHKDKKKQTLYEIVMVLGIKFLCMFATKGIKNSKKKFKNHRKARSFSPRSYFLVYWQWFIIIQLSVMSIEM